MRHDLFLYSKLIVPNVSVHETPKFFISKLPLFGVFVFLLCFEQFLRWNMRHLE